MLSNPSPYLSALICYRYLQGLWDSTRQKRTNEFILYLSSIDAEYDLGLNLSSIFSGRLKVALLRTQKSKQFFIGLRGFRQTSRFSGSEQGLIRAHNKRQSGKMIMISWSCLKSMFQGPHEMVSCKPIFQQHRPARLPTAEHNPIQHSPAVSENCSS